MQIDYYFEATRKYLLTCKPSLSIDFMQKVYREMKEDYLVNGMTQFDAFFTMKKKVDKHLYNLKDGEFVCSSCGCVLDDECYESFGNGLSVVCGDCLRGLVDYGVRRKKDYRDLFFEEVRLKEELNRLSNPYDADPVKEKEVRISLEKVQRQIANF